MNNLWRPGKAGCSGHKFCGVMHLARVRQLQTVCFREQRAAIRLVLTGAVCCRNVAGAERTLQKQLAATRGSTDSVRPDFRQRLTGTLADVIARAAQQDAASGKHGQADRMREIIDHLQSAFDVCPMPPVTARWCS